MYIYLVTACTGGRPPTGGLPVLQLFKPVKTEVSGQPCVRVCVQVSSEFVLSQSGASLLTVYHEKPWILLLLL